MVAALLWAIGEAGAGVWVDIGASGLGVAGGEEAEPEHARHKLVKRGMQLGLRITAEISSMGVLGFFSVCVVDR